jgi:hypothetical protein
MNSERIQKLVLMYKSVNDNKKAKNLLWKEIASEYNFIVDNLLKGTSKQHIEDFRQFIYTDILIKISEYDESYKCLFNSFLYYRLLSVRDRFLKTIKQNYDDKHNRVKSYDLYYEDDISILLNLDFDISKILTSEELLIFMSLCNNKYKYNSKIDGIIKKLQEYTHA